MEQEQQSIKESYRPVLDEILVEAAGARAKHGPMHSAHEAYAVILEELDEFWDIVKMKRDARDLAQMRRELTQVAAMCCRTIVDLGLK